MRRFCSWGLWTLVMWVAFWPGHPAPVAVRRLVPVYSKVQTFLTPRAELWASTR
jgi:hypothetical protein